MEDLLPPGFRFYPTEEELISFYLRNKLEGKGPAQMDQVIPVVDIYDHNPRFLPHFAGERCRGDPEQWFFFTSMQQKAARGGRPSRLTNEGFWKATGSPGYVYSSDNRVIGMKRTMVFYQGRAPNGRKTQWKMNEYIAIDGQPSSSRTHMPPKLRLEVSLCRVYIRSKTMRSFDRRPFGVGVVNTQQQVAARRQPQEKISSSSSSSHGDSFSSSGGDRRQPNNDDNHNNTCDHQNVENYNWDIENMVLDNIDEPWWDWEKSGFGLENEKN